MKQKAFIKAIVVSSLLALALQGCTGGDNLESDNVIQEKIAGITAANVTYANVGSTVDDNGEVSLKGTIPTIYDATNLVCQIAAIQGVNEISTSDLKSSDGLLSTVRDAKIHTNISAKIRNPYVSVNVNAGCVLLTGKVKSAQEMENIAKSVKEVEGVRQVVLKMKVES